MFTSDIQNSPALKPIPKAVLRLITIIARHDQEEALGTGLRSQWQEKCSGRDHWIMEKGNYLRTCAGLRINPDPERLADLDRHIQSETSGAEDLVKKMEAANRRRGLYASLIDDFTAYVAATHRNDIPLEEAAAEPAAKEVGNAVEGVERLREQLRAARLKAKRIDASELPADAIVDGLAAKLRELAKPPVRASKAHNGEWGLIWDMAVTGGVPDGGNVPAYADLRGGYIADHMDEILATARRDIEDNRALSDTMTLTADEKRQALREIAVEILDLERREVALILAADADGIVIDFRPNTDPRALGGITGPAPRKRR